MLACARGSHVKLVVPSSLERSLTCVWTGRYVLLLIQTSSRVVA
jgi:hypothetical protein